MYRQSEFAARLLGDDRFDVRPIQRPAGECLVDDEVLRGAEPQTYAWDDLHLSSARDRGFLERKRRAGDVQVDAILRRAGARHGSELRTSARCGHARKQREQRIDDRFLPAEAGEDRQVHILREPRLPPFLYGDAADEAVLPLLSVEDGLNLRGRPDRRVHQSSPSRNAAAAQDLVHLDKA